MRVIVVEDNLLVRAGLATLLRDRGHEVVALAPGPDPVLALVRTHDPDAVVLDIRMPPTHTDEGLRLAEVVRSRHPGVAVLVLSQYLVASYAAVLLDRSPARVGYLLKDNVLRADVLEGALHRVVAGGTFVDPQLVDLLIRSHSSLDVLSERELEVLRLMAEGLSDRGIAERLTVGLSTVFTHVQHVFAKLDLPAGSSDNRRVRAVVTYLATQRGGAAP
ncbi:response regulator [Oryzobacter terrae]|uniref:response regulator n=1 Tax=Oryzobacter terrae TaxID=1620385 RepID=UPI0036719820